MRGAARSAADASPRTGRHHPLPHPHRLPQFFSFHVFTLIWLNSVIFLLLPERRSVTCRTACLSRNCGDPATAGSPARDHPDNPSPIYDPAPSALRHSLNAQPPTLNCLSVLHARQSAIVGWTTAVQPPRKFSASLNSQPVTLNWFLGGRRPSGPIRQIPGTQVRPGSPPSQADEPDWMRLSTVVGAPAGAGVFRDPRAWHGATPNVSREIRAMPNVEYVAPWVDTSRLHRSMPHDIWARLSPHAQRICAPITTAPGVWPAGAGVMHPLASKRSEAKGAPSAPAGWVSLRGF